LMLERHILSNQGDKMSLLLIRSLPNDRPEEILPDVRPGNIGLELALVPAGWRTKFVQCR
jgi:hypothetical protein